MYETLTTEQHQLIATGEFNVADSETSKLLYSLVLLKYNGEIRINPLLQSYLEITRQKSLFFESEKNNKHFEQLEFVLTERTEPTLILVSADTSAKSEEVYGEFQTKFIEYHQTTFHIENEEMVSLEQWLTKKLPSTKPSEHISEMVHIFGLGSHFHLADGDKLKPSSLLPQINMERELLFRDLPIVMVWWLDKYQIATLRQEAPDLWSWISYHFHFESEEKVSVYDEQIIVEVAKVLHMNQIPTKKEIDEIAKSIEKRYKHFDKQSVDTKHRLEIEHSILVVVAHNKYMNKRLLEAQLDYEKILSLRRQLNKKNQDDILSKLICVLCMQKKYKEAEKYIEESLATSKEKYHAEILFWKAMILQEKGDGQNVLKFLRQSYNLSKKYGNSNYMRGSSIKLAEYYLDNREYKTARKLLFETIKYNPHTESLSIQLYEKIAKSYEEEKNSKFANQYYEKAKKLKEKLEQEENS
jgi:Tfp pilus assembly protein PilF